MKLEHSFTVPTGIEEAWKILLDIERIGPCMPGAAIESVDGDDFTGSVKVKLGPIGLTYKGKASFIEKDADGAPRSDRRARARRPGQRHGVGEGDGDDDRAGRGHARWSRSTPTSTSPASRRSSAAASWSTSATS